jgi:integrase
MTDYAKQQMMVNLTNGINLKIEPHEDNLLRILIESGVIPVNTAPSGGASVATPQDHVQTHAPGPGTPEAPTEPGAVHKNMLLQDAVNAYLKDRLTVNYQFDEKQNRSKLERLVKIVGNIPLAMINSAIADRYRDILMKIPRRQRSNARKKLSPEQLAALGDPDHIKTETVNQRLQAISSLFRWLNSKESSIQNPFFRTTIKQQEGDTRADKKRKKRRRFTPEELKRIFSDEIWSEHRHNHDWEYWLPLVLLHTGARITEIVQLLTTDFGERDGIWFMSINDDPTPEEIEDIWHWAKRIKSDSGVRELPVHSHLAKTLGFRDFVTSRPPGALFPEVKEVADKIAKEPCRRFNDYILPRCGAKSPQTVLYSFRHVVGDELKRRGSEAQKRARMLGQEHRETTDEEIDQLLGSIDSRNVTESVYGSDFSLHQMQLLVEMLDFRAELAGVLPWSAFSGRRTKKYRHSAKRKKRQALPT